MDISEVRRRVGDIRNNANSPERTNRVLLEAKEDFLWFKVLKAIADGANDPQRLAQEALKSLEIDIDT